MCMDRRGSCYLLREDHPRMRMLTDAPLLARAPPFSPKRTKRGKASRFLTWWRPQYDHPSRAPWHLGNVFDLKSGRTRNIRSDRVLPSGRIRSRGSFSYANIEALKMCCNLWEGGLECCTGLRSSNQKEVTVQKSTEPVRWERGKFKAEWVYLNIWTPSTDSWREYVGASLRVLKLQLQEGGLTKCLWLSFFRKPSAAELVAVVEKK